MQFTRGRLVPIILSAFLALPALLASQEPVTITGKVTSDAGQPLGQVEVAIASMGLGGLTRDDGSYSIVVPGARVSGQTVTLAARRLGYKSQTAQVTLTPGGVTHDFVLAANPLQLGEVVVTGAGTASATEKLGNVRNNVASDLIQRSGETNLVEALAAKAPNVTVLQQSGDPGAGSFINIRGISTILGSNQPLFVVDGVPMDNSSFNTDNFDASYSGNGAFGQTEGTVTTNRLADLNPSDIESVEILKGPAASAIYGSRAGAGVVLITTKAGRPGPTHFTLRSSTSFDDVNHTYPLQTLYSQGDLNVAADTTVATGCGRNANAGNCKTSWGPQITAGTPVYDHANEIYRVGYTYSNGITISGGDDRTTFYLSGDNTYQRGIFVGPNNDYSRTTIRFKGTHRLIDPLRIGADFAFVDSRAKLTQTGNNVFGVQLGDLRTPPNFNNLPYSVNIGGVPQERSYRFQSPGPTTALLTRGYDNPFWVLNQQLNTANVGRVYGNVNADYVPLAWLKFNYTLGADYASDERLEGCPIGSTDVCTKGRVISAKIVNYQIDHNLTGTAKYTLSQDFGGTITVGQNLNTRNVRFLGATGRTLVSPTPFKLSNTVTQDLPADSESVIHDVSWFGQGTLDMWDQLHLTAAIRNDGSSTFGRDNLRSWFPKGSVAWEFTKAIGERSWLSYGKARMAYGEAGVEPNPYLTSQTFLSACNGGIAQGTCNTPTQNNIGGLTASITRPASVLKPERSKEFETGLDLGFVKDRADASLTWYTKTSSDVILLEPLAASTGYLNQGANAASIRNRGWEAALNVRVIQRADYGLDLGLQWARNRSLVQSLGPFGHVSIGDFITQIDSVGLPVGVYLGGGFYRCGLTDGSTPVAINAAGTTGPLSQVCAGAPKGALYIDPKGFPVGPDSRIMMDPNYDWTGSVRTSIRYKRLQIAGLLDVRHGGQIWNGTKGSLYNWGTHLDTQNRAVCDATGCTGNLQTFGSSSWYAGPVVGPGAGTAVPIGENWYAGYAACPYTGIDEACIEDAGFVKLREVSISYTIDAPWVQRTLGFASIDLRVSGRNLKTWSNYTGYDPETNLGGAISSNLGASGVDYFSNPQTRSFSFAVTLNH
ncbi:MAG: hypothetical protein DMD33_01755 [Gemmatimonadetes bacterium]|nr:MAG: hypothetical protein DMD33_01755 [Gemmatimonadota bacterium]